MWRKIRMPFYPENLYFKKCILEVIMKIWLYIIKNHLMGRSMQRLGSRRSSKCTCTNLEAFLTVCAHILLSQLQHSILIHHRGIDGTVIKFLHMLFQFPSGGEHNLTVENRAHKRSTAFRWFCIMNFNYFWRVVQWNNSWASRCRYGWWWYRSETSARVSIQ